MEGIEFLAEHISSRYGNVRRARGCFLYTAKGVRLTDLYQEGGRAILGWGGSPAVTALKDALSRGASGSYRTDWDHRLDKALSDLLGFPARGHAYARPEEAAAAAQELGGQAVRWTPWKKQDFQAAPAVIVEPPFPMAEGITLLAVRSGQDGACPPERSIRLPAPLQAAFARSLYDAIKAEKERQEKDFFIYDRVLTRYWKREGPWLSPTVPQDRYRDFILHCLDCELVISPDYGRESLVPYGADPGVFRKLERQPFDL